MSFLSKIARSVKKVLKPIRPFLSAIPGPIGMAARTLETVGSMVGRVRPERQVAGTEGRLGTLTWKNFPTDVADINAQLAREAQLLQFSRGRAMSLTGITAVGGMAMLPAVARGGALVVGWVFSAAGRAIAWVTARGVRFTKRKAWDLAKRVGLETAALTLGLSAIELAQWLFGDPGTMPGRPRRRGISYGQLQNARRVNRRLLAAMCELQDIGKVKVTGVKRSCR